LVNQGGKKMKSRIVIAIVVLALTGCSASFFNFSTPTPTGPTPTPLSEQQIMDQIQTQVISIRGLQPTGPVTPNIGTIA
jgi:flagellar basal body-associated protein FliL